MKILKNIISPANLLLLGILFLNACKPVSNLIATPVPWHGDMNLNAEILHHDASKKNVFIIADSKMTVLFDMIAPFYLFNATEKTNVYIVAKDKTPILIKKDLFVKPQMTFAEADAMKLQADVIVIPALSKRDEHQDTIVINWIKNHFTINTKMLAVCDGASTAAATGLYDGKPLTCHASDYANLKKHFNKPGWVRNTAVTKSGNLFSTAGVSNAVEGSLLVINELFGRETMQKLMANIKYPAAEIKMNHLSNIISGNSKFQVAKKICFKKNKNVGLLIEDGINEFEMASIIDTYSRTLPASLTVCNLNGSTTGTKYGLTLISTGDTDFKKSNELHLMTPGLSAKQEAAYSKNTQLIRYHDLQRKYAIDICLERIAKLYGHGFEKVVKQMLDYN